MSDMAHPGWRSRGYLPHYDGAGMTQHVVFGLADAFPDESKAPTDRAERFRWREAALDCGLGERLLQDEAATEVQSALLHFDGLRYALMAWCVMPNHVHALVTTAHGWALNRIVHSWKSYTANKINAMLGRERRLWRREYYDHFVRTDEEYVATCAYIENNPVAARLASSPADWRWSSAWQGSAG
jgi:REP element-mobilizing transposase RayT